MPTLVSSRRSRASSRFLRIMSFDSSKSKTREILLALEGCGFSDFFLGVVSDMLESESVEEEDCVP